MWYGLVRDNNPQAVFDKHYSLRCPHCATQANFTAISIPRYELADRFKPKRVVIGYRCDACNDMIALRFSPSYDFGNHRVGFADAPEQLERPTETFEFGYLPAAVAADLKEALTCYSLGCNNAFAAMCRRCVQSVATDLGAKGSDRVIGQLQELKESAGLDDETYNVLKQVIVDGHDGAHPHLPDMTEQRAGVLLELIKDVLYQLYVRKGKLQDAMKLRSEAIQNRKK